MQACYNHKIVYKLVMISINMIKLIYLLP